MIVSSIPINATEDVPAASAARQSAQASPRAMFVDLMLWALLAGLVRIGAQSLWLIVNIDKAASNAPQQALQLAATGGLILSAFFARLLAQRGRLLLAASFFYVSSIATGLLLGLGAPFALPMAIAMPTVAMVIALPHVSRRVMLLMAAGIGAQALLAMAVDAILGQRLPYTGQAALMRLTFVTMFVLVVVALIREHRWLQETSDGMTATNEELSQIRDTLEEQVASRTSQLVQQVDVVRGAQVLAARERDFATGIITAVSQGLTIVDADHRVRFANPAFTRMLGRSERELMGMSWHELCLPEDHVLYAAWLRGLHSGEPAQRMMRLCRADGSAVYVDVSSLPTRAAWPGQGAAAEDAVPAHVIVVTDLSAQMQADAERRLLQSVVEHSDEPIMITDSAVSFDRLRILYVNKAFERLSGYSGEDLLGRSPTTLAMSEVDDDALAYMRAALREGRSMTMELPFVRCDARETWVEWNVTPVRDQTGAVAQWVGMLRETTARRRAEERLKHQNAYLAALHETALGIVNHLDLDELLRSLAGYMVRLTGAPDGLIVLFDPVTGRATHSAGEGAWSTHVARQFHRGVGVVGSVWESGQPIVVENYAEWERRDATFPPELIGCVAGAPVISNGAPAGALVISRALPAGCISTDTVELLSRLAQIASVAYDNARLFAAARANEQELELRVEQRTRELRQALNDNGRLRELAVQAAAQSERARLARELHDSVSQALYGIALGARTIQESGAAKLAPQMAGPLEYILQLTEAGLTEMRALIFELRPEALQEEGLHAALKKQTDAIRLRFRLKVTAQLCSEPDCDFAVKEALYRIALESIHNAVKHARASEIVLVLSENDDGVMVEVRDNGKGFDPGAIYPGHLGLKSMRERALALKGHLSIDSAPEQGATVRARLPSWPDHRTNSLGATLEMFGA